jgi:uncharacterized DUF497 family protein
MTEAGLYAWDERKRISNFRKHGVDFAIVQNFDFETALVLRDDRKNYGEVRYRAYGKINAASRLGLYAARRTCPRHFTAQEQRKGDRDLCREQKNSVSVT